VQPVAIQSVLAPAWESPIGEGVGRVAVVNNDEIESEPFMRVECVDCRRDDGTDASVFWFEERSGEDLFAVEVAI
jgi:hypothetical protein